MPIEPLVDEVIKVIKQNLIAKTNVTSDVTTGDVIINVENSFHFRANEEIILIDYDYNLEGSPHYQVYEYSKIKKVNNTNSITLTTPITSDWMVASNAFVQKTIGHSPLYENQVYYGDREVIPTDLMAITVEPVSMTNEWMYIRGGLSEEYKLKIAIYGKSIDTDEGRRILDRYSDAVVQFLNLNIHPGVLAYSTPLLTDIAPTDMQITIEDTVENRENIVLSSELPSPIASITNAYQLQDNKGATYWFSITDIQYSGGNMIITMDKPANLVFEKAEYAVIKRIGMYIWDSRADNAVYGVVSKGSAILRASEISWYGKYINEFKCPQLEYGLDSFKKIT
jgi:hypothetical protein